MKCKLTLIIALCFIVAVGFSGCKKKAKTTSSLGNQAQVQVAKTVSEKAPVNQDQGQEEQIQGEEEGQQEQEQIQQQEEEQQEQEEQINLDQEREQEQEGHFSEDEK